MLCGVIIMKIKRKMLIVKRKPHNTGEVVRRVNVTFDSKKDIDRKWDNLEKEYSDELYVISLSE